MIESISHSHYISIVDLAEFLNVPVSDLKRALRAFAVERTDDGRLAVSGGIVLRLLLRAVDLEMHVAPPGMWTAPANAKHKRRRSIPRSVREAIAERDGNRCRYCGRKAAGLLQMDHLIPFSLGGGEESINLVMTCPPCNSRKRNMIAADVGMKLRKAPNADPETNAIQKQLAQGELTALHRKKS